MRAYIDSDVLIWHLRGERKAATAIQTGGTIFTLNKKHYPMPELLVSKAG